MVWLERDARAQAYLRFETPVPFLRDICVLSMLGYDHAVLDHAVLVVAAPFAFLIRFLV